MSSVRGGAGGVEANFDDMLSLARLYDETGDELRQLSLRVGALAASGDLTGSAVLAPGTFAACAWSLARVTSGLLVAGVEAEGQAAALELGVQLYREADEMLTRAAGAADQLGGWALGVSAPATVPMLLLGEGVAELPGYLADLLSGEADFDDLPGRVLTATGEDLQRFLLEHPNLAEHLVSGSGGLLSGLLRLPPGTLDFATAVQLSALLFEDGRPVLGPGGPLQPGDDVPPMTVTGLLLGVDRRQRRGRTTAKPGEIGIQTVVARDGVSRVIVQLPGTESWSLTPGPGVRDAATNVLTMAGATTTYMRGVQQALEAADVAPGTEVMLVGHSQGGMTAAALAANSEFRDRFTVTHVVTAGAPIAPTEVPPDVQVLALENEYDLIPRLDGRPNSDAANITTVTLSQQTGDIGGNHALTSYAELADRELPFSDPSVDRWLASAEGFLAAGGTATTRTTTISRQP